MTEKHRTTTLREAAEQFKLAISYATPQREWVWLTDREMMDAIYIDDTPMEMGRKIEAKLKEKNT